MKINYKYFGHVIIRPGSTEVNFLSRAGFLGGPEKGRFGSFLGFYQVFDQVGDNPRVGIIYRSPRILLANWMSFGMMVTRLA